MSSRNVRSTSRFHSPARRTALIGMTVVASVLLVTACGGDPVPTDGPSRLSVQEPSVNPSDVVESTPSDKATSEPSPDMPARPAALKKNDLDSAAESAEYFLDLYGYSMATLDTQDLEALVSDDCGFCANFVDQIAEMVEKEQQFHDGTFELSDPVYDPDENESGTAEIFFYMDQDRVEIVGPADDTVAEYSASSMAARVSLVYTDNSWVVTRVVAEEEPE